MSKRDVREQDLGDQVMKLEEDIEEEDLEQPLELGGFLTPVNFDPTIETPTDVPATDLAPGHVILFDNSPFEIIGKTASLAQSGPLNSRHKIYLQLIDLFTKQPKTDTLAVNAREHLKLVKPTRVRYTLVGFHGTGQEIMILQKQHRERAGRVLVSFRIPAGVIGDELGPFFTQCDDEEDGSGHSITLLMLEAVGRFQLVGFGIGDWESLG